jgi:hypothetical protein
MWGFRRHNHDDLAEAYFWIFYYLSTLTVSQSVRRLFNEMASAGVDGNGYLTC